MFNPAFTAAPSRTFADAAGMPGAIRALAAGLRRRVAASRKAAAERQTARLLLTLDPHLLDDIGMTRDALHRMLREPYA